MTESVVGTNAGKRKRVCLLWVYKTIGHEVMRNFFRIDHLIFKEATTLSTGSFLINCLRQRLPETDVCVCQHHKTWLKPVYIRREPCEGRLEGK